MCKKDQEYYVWVMEECIKSTYEEWGIDMMSMYDEISRDFPGATTAINKIYKNWEEYEFYEAEAVTFEKPKYVYEAIANLIPATEVVQFDIKTKEQDVAYKWLNIGSWDKFVSIERIHLVMAILLFTEEFILLPITDKSVLYDKNTLTVIKDFITFEVAKDEEKTYVSITIKDIMFLQYQILN